MDMLVPMMFYGGLLALCLIGLMASWKLLYTIRTRGWRSLLPTLSFPGWNSFWFAPADPTVLGLIRIVCGAVTTYTVFSYGFMLQAFMHKVQILRLPLGPRL